MFNRIYEAGETDVFNNSDENYITKVIIHNDSEAKEKCIICYDDAIESKILSKC